MRTLTPSLIQNYRVHLIELEKIPATVEQYIRYILVVSEYMNGREITKPILIEWKDHVTEECETSSINTMLAALNSFLDYTAGRILKLNH